ncbi:TSUP family transporter [Streptomyces sp. NPDC055103]
MTRDLLTSPHLLALIGVFAGAVAQSATGMGFSLIAAPLMVVCLGPHEGVASTVVLAALASVLPLARDRRHTRVVDVIRLLVPTVVCTPLFAFAFRGMSTRWLAVIAGAGVLAAVALLASGVRSRWMSGRHGALAAGAGSALLNVVGGVGGPPIGLYAANAEWDAATTRGSLSAFFIVQNLVTALLLGFVAPGAEELSALVAGTACGVLIARRLPSALLRTAVLSVSTAGGLGLITGAL